LQLAALFQMIDKLPGLTTIAGYFSIAFLSFAGLLTLVSLGFLAASIYPQRFDYVAPEPALLTYTRQLIRDEQDPANRDQADPFSALVTLKTELARQYAAGADHNRQINKGRERLRSVAGLAALGSVAMTVFLVAATYAHYLSQHDEKDSGHANPRVAAEGAPTATSRPNPVGQPVKPANPHPAAHAGGDKGVVDAP